MFSVIASENQTLILINLITFEEAVRKLESELNLSEENYLRERNKKKIDQDEEIKKLKEQIATKDKIINDLKQFIDSKEKLINEHSSKVKELQEFKEKDFKNIFEENESFKKQLAKNDQMIRNMERECLSTSEIINHNLQLIKDNEDFKSKLEAAEENFRGTKRRHDEEMITLEKKTMKQEEKNSNIIMTKNLIIKNKDKIIGRQKLNIKLFLDEIKKTKS